MKGHPKFPDICPQTETELHTTPLILSTVPRVVAKSASILACIGYTCTKLQVAARSSKSNLMCFYPNLVQAAVDISSRSMHLVSTSLQHLGRSGIHPKHYCEIYDSG